MARVELDGVSKIYPGKRTAVAPLSVDIAHGEFLSIVGPSGCGKSTTLHMIAGLETPSSGQIRIDGERVNERSPGERDIAMVFQSYALYPHRDVRRNLTFPLEVQKLPKSEIEARVRETAELLGLGDLLSRKPAELSGGQRQRVALGRALVRRPKVFLFDEPLSNLDTGLRAQMRAELKKLHERLGATFVYVTHDQTEAMTLSDRVLVMDRGSLQQLASPRELYRAPANTFVARFFGAPPINLVSPSLLGIPAPTAGLTLGVRPEHLSLAADGVPATVYLVEPVGAETWLTVELGAERLMVRAPSTDTFQTGQHVHLQVDMAQLHWFDEQSGKRRDAHSA